MFVELRALTDIPFLFFFSTEGNHCGTNATGLLMRTGNLLLFQRVWFFFCCCCDKYWLYFSFCPEKSLSFVKYFSLESKKKRWKNNSFLKRGSPFRFELIAHNRDAIILFFLSVCHIDEDSSYYFFFSVILKTKCSAFARLLFRGTELKRRKRAGNSNPAKKG